MIVLGIDPGTANTGYGVVRGGPSRCDALDGGTITTTAARSPERRLVEIHLRLLELIEEHQPTAVAIEDVYFGVNARSAFAVGQARGAALLAAGLHDIACTSYTPQQVKGAVCGHGNAGKEEVTRMVATLLGLDAPPASDHAADALATAICHLNRAPLRAALAVAAR